MQVVGEFLPECEFRLRDEFAVVAGAGKAYDRGWNAVAPDVAQEREIERVLIRCQHCVFSVGQVGDNRLACA